MVVLEYLRAGVPIITTKGNNVSQIVKLSKSGVEFQIDLKEELSKALETVASSREIFSVRAIQHFESHYSEKKWLKELMSIVAETISEDLVVK